MSNGASDRILQSVLVEGEYSENMRVIRENMATLQSKLLGQAAQVLGSWEKGSDQNIANAWTKIDGLEGGITTSGGLLVLVAQVSGQAAVGELLTRLSLDGEIKSSGRAFGASNVVGVIGHGTGMLFWAGSVPAGKHTVLVEGYGQAGGTVTISGGSGYTALWALEFIS